MNRLENKSYQDDINRVANLDINWDDLKKKRILISGGSGMIGSFLVDVLMYKNWSEHLDCSLCVMGRSQTKIEARFSNYLHDKNFAFICRDACQTKPEVNGSVDYVLHLASNTHPAAYAKDPIGTVTANVIGTYRLLGLATKKKANRFLFPSSVEIYGENRGDTELFDEAYCGYIDCNTLRAGYPESKRCGEALCQAYRKQMGLNVVIPRLTRTYGPTMLPTDTKAISQFILKGVAKEDIVLKSAGKQFYSYTYVADAVAGILTVLLCGKDGEAYNIADESSDITLKDLAELVAARSGKKVVYESPDVIESLGYSKATKARLDGRKLRQLGWKPKYDINAGIDRTISILSEIWDDR